YVLCWDLGRYVNHSFNSNCLTTAYDLEIAIRDIQPGEQLTDDYGYLNVNKPFRAASEGTKRKTVYPDDLLRYYKVWDKKLMTVLKYVPQVDQPLWSLVPDSSREELNRISEKPEEMISIINCYYRSENGKEH
ncbi:MAG: SET domain-containing protein, partial [Cyclobacteriaceae bacterium]|nr:SET domain-containing protein [Cyclobacteriaceae bacterium]